MIIRMTDVCADLQYPSDDGIPQPILFDDEDDESLLDQSQIDFDDESGTETVMSEDESPYWTLLNAVKTYRDDTGQTIYEPFVKLPSKRSVHVFIASAFGKNVLKNDFKSICKTTFA